MACGNSALRLSVEGKHRPTFQIYSHFRPGVIPLLPSVHIVGLNLMQALSNVRTVEPTRARTLAPTKKNLLPHSNTPCRKPEFAFVGSLARTPFERQSPA